MLITKGSQASYEPAPSPFLNFMPLLSLPSCIYLGSNQTEMLSLSQPPTCNISPLVLPLLLHGPIPTHIS